MIEIVNTLLNDTIGRWFLYFGVFVVTVIGAVYFAIKIKGRIDAIVDSLAVVKDQVANDHKYPDGTPINMRDDLDGKHTVTDGKLDILVDLVRGQGGSIEALQRGQSSLYQLILANTTDIEALQAIGDTKTRAEINKIIGDNHDGKHAQPYAG